VSPNNVDDAQLLAEALPNLQERTNLDTLVTDDGYGGGASDSALQDQNVTLIKLPFGAHNPTRTNSASPTLTFSTMKRAAPPRSPARRDKRFPFSRDAPLAGSLRPNPLLYLSLPTGWTLSHSTPKARSALSADIHHSRSSERQTAQRLSCASKSQPQFTFCRGSHRALGETSISGRQVAGVWTVQSNLHGNRIRRRGFFFYFLTR